MKQRIFLLTILLSIIVGIFLGFIFKEDVIILKPISTMFSNILYTVSVPLIFFNLTNSISKMKNPFKILKSTFLVFLITSIISCLFMLIFVLIIDPGIVNVVLENKELIDINSVLVNTITVDNFNELFSKNHIIPLIIFSIILGISINKLGNTVNNIKNCFNSISLIMNKIVSLMMYFIPFFITISITILVGDFGFNIFGSFIKSMTLFYSVGILYFIFFNTIYAYIANGFVGVKMFYKHIYLLLLTSLSNTPLATLPISMKVCDKMGINKDVSNISISLGSKFNNVGTSMLTVFKIVFLFSLFNITVNVDSYLLIIMLSVITGIITFNIEGVDDYLIITLFNLPINSISILTTINYLTKTMVQSLNASGDVTSAMLIEKMVE